MKGHSKIDQPVLCSLLKPDITSTLYDDSESGSAKRLDYFSPRNHWESRQTTTSARSMPFDSGMSSSVDSR